MKIEVIGARELPADLVAAWSRLQQADPSLASPFFRPEFALAVEATRGGVEVAVWQDGGEPVGFLPFQRQGRRGLPVGSPMSDYQGAIVRSDVAWSPQEVIRAARLRSWHFDHLVASQAAFANFQYVWDESPYIDLSEGYEAYLQGRNKTFRKGIKRAERIALETGDIRFQVETALDEPLEKLIAWKKDKCRQTQIPCTFAYQWSVDLVRHIAGCTGDHFAGMLTSLYIGEQLAAVQCCIRSGAVLHEWVSSYNQELSDCSPGRILEDRLGRIVGELGITRIDMGKGDEDYKQRYATHQEMLAEGAVHAWQLGGSLSRAWSVTKDRLRSTPLRGPVRRVRRWTVSTRAWLRSARSRPLSQPPELTQGNA